MKLSKAIEILSDQATNPDMAKFPDLKDSVLLAIEALKRIITMRSYNINQAILPLPSERPIEDLSPSADRKRKLRESPLGRPPRG